MVDTKSEDEHSDVRQKIFRVLQLTYDAGSLALESRPHHQLWHYGTPRLGSKTR